MKVFGIRPPGDEWELKQAVYDACIAAHVEIPAEITKFFNGKPPNVMGVWVDLEKTCAAKRWEDKEEEGFNVDVRAVFKDSLITVIRFSVPK